MKKIYLTISVIFSLIIGCSVPREEMLMFSNIDWNAMSVRPVLFSTHDFTLRISVNNGGSIDRIITLFTDIYNDTLMHYNDTTIYGEIQYIGTKFKKNNNEPLYSYNSECIEISRVKEIIDTLSLFNFMDITSRPQISSKEHTPFSTYIIEIKNRNKYNSFYFETEYPEIRTLDTLYEKIETILFKLFPELKKRQ